MSEVRIFIESKLANGKSGADENFIRGLLQKRNIPSNFSLRFEGLDGKDMDKFQKTLPLFIDNDSEGKNLIIIDSDQDNIAQKRTEISQFLIDNNITAQIFFFPNDNAIGELEDLLLGCIPQTREEYINCFSAFENCARESGQRPPDKKDKLHIYCSSFLTNDEHAQRAKHVYPNADYFHERFFDVNSPSLNPLINFLTRNLSTI